VIALLAATHHQGAPTLVLPKIAYLSILPILVMFGGAVIILAGSSLVRRSMDLTWSTSIAVLTASVSLTLALFQWFDVRNHGPHVAIGSAVVQDGFSAMITILVSCAVFVSALVGDGWLRREGQTGPEFHVLLLLSASGAMVMGAANDLIVVFLGLEILSIALYVLAAFNSRRNQSGEAALKYFVLGSFSSAVFLYGIALVYGATGTTDLPQIADFLARNVLLHNGMLLGGLALLLVGFGFKVAAVPFHLWTPDVYDGSPSPVTGFMAAVAKAGGFAALLRVFVSSFGLLRDDWRPAVWAIAAATLLLGAIVALVQRNIKRMLAYSSINHAGFILLGLQAATNRGVEAALYYLFVYAFMVIGSFAVVGIVSGRGDGAHDLDRYRNLAARQPWLAGSLAILLMAQAGIPFTTGFLAKLEVVSASVDAGSTALAVIAMVSAAIAAFFYLRVVVLMYAPASASTGTVASAGIPSGTDAGTPLAEVGVTSVGVTSVSVTSVGGASVGGPSAGVTSVGVPTGAVPAAVASAPLPMSLETEASTVPGSTPEASGVQQRTGSDDELVLNGTTGLAIFLCVGVTVVFGLIPGPLLDLAHQATLLVHP
jgi:NADH-quinone oxidoreductase subunit N